MRLGIYKKVFGGPEVINLNGKMVTVQKGQMVAAPASVMMGRRGFSFVRFVEDTPETLSSQPLPQMKGYDDQQVSVETMNAFEEIDIEEVIISEEEVRREEENSQPKEEEAPPEQSGFTQEVIDELKGYNHRQWFTMKKNQIKKILTEANIDFSHIPDEKWELLSFLKSLINID